MPKEKFFDDASMYDLHVGWSPDSYVQIGIETHDCEPIAKNLNAGSLTYENPQPCIFLVKHEPHQMEMSSGELIASIYCDGDPKGAALFTGLWGTFDRVTINQLIRTLRKARDQAFGKDE